MNFNINGFGEGVAQYQNEQSQKTANRLKNLQLRRNVIDVMPAGANDEDVTELFSYLTGGESFFDGAVKQDWLDAIMEKKKQDHEYQQNQRQAQEGVWRQQKNDRFTTATKRAILNSDDPSKVQDTAFNYLDEDEQESFKSWYDGQDIGNMRSRVVREEAVRTASDIELLGYSPDSYKESDVYTNAHPDVQADIDRRMSTRANENAMNIMTKVETNLQTNALQDRPLRDALAAGDQEAVEQRVRALIPRNAQRYYNEGEVTNLSRNLIKQNRPTAQRLQTTTNIQLASQIAAAYDAQGKKPSELMSDPNLPDDVKQQSADLLQRKIDERVGGEIEAVSQKFKGNATIQDLVEKGEWEAIERHVRGTIEREHPEIAGDEAVEMVMGSLKTELEPITAAIKYNKVVDQNSQAFRESLQRSRKVEIAEAATNTQGDIPSFYKQETISSVSYFDDDQQDVFNTNVAGAYNTLVNTTMVPASVADEVFDQIAGKYAQNGTIPNAGSLQAEAHLMIRRSGNGHLLEDPSTKAADFRSQLTRELLENRDAGSVLMEYENNVGQLLGEIGEYDAVVERYAQTMDKQEFLEATRNAKTKHLTDLTNMRSKVGTMMNNPEAFTGFDRQKVINMMDALDTAIKLAREYDFGAKAQEVYGKQQAERQQPEQRERGLLDQVPYSFFGFGNLPQ